MSGTPDEVDPNQARPAPPPKLLAFSSRLTVLPIVHGSLDFSVRVREELLGRDYQCLAVPLPASWRDAVLTGVEQLPRPAAVVQAMDDETFSYVPIDPCQPVVTGLRTAITERMAIEFIDLESQAVDPSAPILPDPYALRKMSVEKYFAAVLPTLVRPAPDSLADRRHRRMAFELHRLELHYDNTLFLCHIADWPWVLESFRERKPYPAHENYFSTLDEWEVDRRTLLFFMGELPYIAGLYERSRATLDPDENLAVDGVMQLTVEARDRWRKGRDDGGGWLGPGPLQAYLQYVRNLTLLHRRLSPDLYTLAVAGKQIGGDSFARSVIEVARDYGAEYPSSTNPQLRMGVDRGWIPGHGAVRMASRLPGPAVVWRSCELRPEPVKSDKRRWQMQWNPYSQCSHLPEDDRIESFQKHVRDRARAVVGQDLARSEKFTSSLKDGLDIRETLRHWYSGDLYVKVIPPSRGSVEIVVFLFDQNADPERYVWQTTWVNEHDNESVIAFYATNFMEDPIGPGICRSKYGGVFFLFPPRPIPDVWNDRRLPRTGPLDDRLVAAAVFHSREPYVAVVSARPLKAAWKAAAQRQGKRLVHLPISQFSGRTVDRLRNFHVLNGREIRSFASRYIHED